MAKVDDESSHYRANGTSFAAPQVAGIATVLRAAHPPLKADECKAVLLAAAQQTPESAPRQHAGVGCGYLDAVVAHEIAGSDARHGRDTLQPLKPRWERCIAVTKGKRYRFAIAWHRKDVQSTSWARLKLEVRDGTTLITQSVHTRNTEQFVRFDAPITGVLRIVVSSPTTALLPQTFGWACSEETSPHCADLVIDSHTINTTSLEVGKRFLGSFVVKNRGQAYSISAKNALYLSDDPTITTSDRFLGWVGVGGMMPGQKQARQLWFTVPTGLPATAWFGVITDYDSRVPEVVETNNASPGIRCSVKGATLRPDLQASMSISATELVAGKTVTIRASTMNRGDGVAGPSMMGIYIGKVLVRRVDVPSVPARQSFGGPYICRVPNCIGDTTRIIVTVRADILSQVQESSEINNDWQMTRGFQPWSKVSNLPSLEYVPTLRPGVDLKSATVRMSQGANLQMCFQVPSTMHSQFYLLFWSLSNPPQIDVTTDLSLSLLNGPIFANWFSKAPPPVSPLLRVPALPPLASFKVYTHALVFPSTLTPEPLETVFVR